MSDDQTLDECRHDDYLRDSWRDREIEWRDPNDVPPNSGPLDELEGPPYDAEDDSWTD